MSKIEEYQKIQKELFDTFVKKNQDYGNDNLDTFGKIGIMIRLQDKINRFINVSKNNINLGDYAKRNHAHYFKGDIRPHGQFEKIYRKAFESAYLIESSFSKIFLKYSGYDMISANGKFIQ